MWKRDYNCIYENLYKADLAFKCILKTFGEMKIAK
jgi:hypothetical protein